MGPQASRLRPAKGAQATNSRPHPAFMNPAPSNIGFLSSKQIPLGFGPKSNFAPVMGDFNGDGKKDAATLVYDGTSTYYISAVLGNGDGTFQPYKLSVTTNTWFEPILVGDVNGDGKDDIVMVQNVVTPGGVEVFLSNGDGTFTSQGPVAISSTTVLSAALVDVNGDQKLDVVAADSSSPSNLFWTMLGNGDGTFQSPSSVALPGYLTSAFFADFNGDGVIDIAGKNSTATIQNQIQVYLSSLSGYQGPFTLYTPDAVYDSCFETAGDLSGDLRPEIVSANCNDNTITIYVNNGVGAFSTGVYYFAGVYPQALTIANIAGGPVAEIVSSNDGGSDITVLISNGDGTVQVPTVGYAAGGYIFTPALVGDFRGFGFSDVLVQDWEYSFVFLPSGGGGASPVNYYSPAVNNTVAGQPYGLTIATGDFNLDGNPDFVIGNNGNTNTGVTVFLSNPNGTMKPGVNYGSGGGLQYVAVADFNGDRILDIAATDYLNGVVQLFYGVGDGTFVTGGTYPTDTTPFQEPVNLVAADLNHDGKIDLAVVNYATQNVAILLNNGSGFAAPVTYPLSAQALDIAAADIDGDKVPDLIVPLYLGTTGVATFHGNGDGTFQPESDVSFGPLNYTHTPVIADFNGDGNPDLAVSIDDTTNGMGIAVSLGNGNGTFQAPVLYATTLQNTSLDQPWPKYIQAVDLNQDGFLDLVYTNAEYGTVGVIYGKGDGTFYDPREYPTGGVPLGIAVADVNGDGALDAITAGDRFSGITVLLNSGASTTQVYSSVTSAVAGQATQFSAQVFAAVPGVTVTPTGSITFIDGATTLGTTTLDSTGLANITTSSLAAGSHVITGKYTGDANFLASTSGVLPFSVTQATDFIGLTPSANSVAKGQTVTLTATVSDTTTSDTLVPTGSVTFKDGATTLGSAALNASGVASFGVSTLALGSHSITALYGGDSNFPSATSAVASISVVQGTDAVALASSSNSVTAGKSVTFTATVSNTVTGDTLVPTGTVTFKDGSTVLGSPALNASGVATFATTTLAVGSHTITAQYAGDANFPAAASSSLIEVVTAVPDYTLTASAPSQTVKAGSPATFTITLTPSNGYDGTITFSCGTLATGMSCAFNPSSLTPVNGQAGQVTLTVATTARALARMLPPAADHSRQSSTLLASLSAVGILGLCLGSTRRARSQRMMLLGLLALAVILSLPGCGGGSSSGSSGNGGGGSGGTPTGNQTVTVTANGTAGTNGGSTSAHPLTLTVTVQ
jgi:hypothetical protein